MAIHPNDPSARQAAEQLNVDDVARVLEAGRILRSVLTEDEIAALVEQLVKQQNTK